MMMCRKILKITLEDHVQHYVGDDLEDEVDHEYDSSGGDGNDSDAALEAERAEIERKQREYNLKLMERQRKLKQSLGWYVITC